MVDPLSIAEFIFLAYFCFAKDTVVRKSAQFQFAGNNRLHTIRLANFLAAYLDQSKVARLHP
jgi:hypothetical protein